MTKPSKLLIPIGGAALASLTVVVIWVAWTMLTADSPTSRTVTVGSALMMKYYSSVDEMSDDADVVVVGTVNGVAETGMDRGRDGSFITPIPYTLYSVKVLEVLKGDVGSTIYVFRNNPEDFHGAPLTRLMKNETVVMYLYEHDSENTPTITTATDFIYVPLAFDNAILDISLPNFLGATGRINDNTIVTPRGKGSGKFAAGTTFQFSELREAVVIDK